jgi:hypothetical protein
MNIETYQYLFFKRRGYKMQMTNRERLLAAFGGEETDRFCWSPLVDEFFSASLPEMGYPAMSNIEFGKFIGYDIMERHVNPYKINYGDKIVHKEEIKGDETVTTTETPVGTIVSVFKNSVTGGCITKYPIETIEDLKVYQYVLENCTIDRDYELFTETDKCIGDAGLATASIFESGIQHLISRKTGLEEMVYMKYDYPDEFEQIVWTWHEVNKKILEVTCESPAQLIFCYEGTSTTVISKDMYETYSLPQTNDYADITHKYGKKFVTHMCGKLQGFKELVSSGRQDGIDSLCPPSTGDVKLREGLEIFPGKMLIGGIEPPALAMMSVEETEAYVIEVLEACKHSKKFILSTGDATPYATPVENIKKVLEVVKGFKK